MDMNPGELVAAAEALDVPELGTPEAASAAPKHFVPADFRAVHDVPVTVQAVLGRVRMPVADLLRLNLAIPPSATPSPYGILGGDLAGFPNGRRLADDIVAIELRAVAGATIPLVDPSFTPDGAAGVLVDGTSNTNSPLLTSFPYMGTPAGGYQTTPGTPAS